VKYELSELSSVRVESVPTSDEKRLIIERTECSPLLRMLPVSDADVISVSELLADEELKK
jgi:hypothetical protein